MAIKGTFEKTPPTQVLNLIGLAKRSGLLHIYDVESPIFLGDHLIELGFVNGKLAYADSKDRPSGLIEVLRAAGKINDRQLELIQQNRLGKTEKSLALMLINGNFVDRDTIMRCLERHIMDVVFELLTWRQAFYQFEQSPLPNDRVFVDITVTDVIDQGKRHSLELQTLEDMLPDLSLPLTLLEHQVRRMRFSDMELNVISFVTGQRSIADIARACHVTDGTIRRVVLGLIEKGVLEVIVPPGPSAEQ
jgi:hypothetical protein